MIEVKDFDERSYLITQLEEAETKVMSLQNNTYAAPHVWNLVAKAIRGEFEGYTFENTKYAQAKRNALTDLALVFAKRFTEDEGFDPLTWLDKCSPDTERFPFSELWNQAK